MRYDGYELYFRKYEYVCGYNGELIVGIEAWTCGEPYCTVCEQKPEYFIEFKHEPAHEGCMWADARNKPLLDELCKLGLICGTGRTQDMYGKHYEVMYDKTWFDSLSTVRY